MAGGRLWTWPFNARARVYRLHVWLGVPIIPVSPSLACECWRFGDYLLSCGKGPYRIRRHNALRDILFHTLRQDNSSVAVEQRVDGSSSSRPGDIFHSELWNWKPTFLDVSVTNSLQPNVISQASAIPGRAAVQAESTKDERE